MSDDNVTIDGQDPKPVSYVFDSFEQWWDLVVGQTPEVARVVFTDDVKALCAEAFRAGCYKTTADAAAQVRSDVVQGVAQQIMPDPDFREVGEPDPINRMVDLLDSIDQGIGGLFEQVSVIRKIAEFRS